MGRHAIAVDFHHITDLLKLSFATSIIFGYGFLAVRTSIILFYHRVFTTAGFRKILHVALAVIIAQFIAFQIPMWFQCRPLRHLWNLEVQASCYDQTKYLIASSAINPPLDIGILVLPMPVVWHLQMSRGRKIALSVVFTMGSL
ncbi:MAG: hypothetical protein M1826_003163 [Phylliscum demangeonii]|nr:MAG: hypothetical protein M1826_003163 [Phylliscum demangeonii]